MKRICAAVLIAAVLVPGLFPGMALASDNKTKKAPSDTTKKESDYEKFRKGKMETHEGFITVHKAKDKVYFEFPLELQDREMLMGSTVSEISDNGDAVIGSKPSNPLHIRFERVGKKMNLYLVSRDYITDSANPALKKAIEMGSTGAIIKTFQIDSFSGDSTKVVFDVTDFFVGDNKYMSPFDNYGANVSSGAKRMSNYQSDRSFLVDVKAFSDNLSVKSSLSYTYTLSSGGRDIAKDVPFTAVMTRSIILLEREPMRPRAVDSRIGIFPTEKVLFSDSTQQTETVYFANRWRMEPSDTAAFRRGEKVKPVKPIIFYIDPAFPESWKPAIFEAVNQWKEPFEKIGFKDAIEAREYPKDDPEFDPDNIRYSCIRYAPIGIQNAMGPSWVDPRSGEILNASVYVYHDVVKLVNNWRYIQTAQAEPSIRSGHLPQGILEDALRYVITHEVGHCLGLMHNMGSSATIPVESLRDPDFTREHGTTHSIMDYARFNYVAQPGDEDRGVRLTPPKFGTYDYWAIRYSYMPVLDVDSFSAEKAVTDRWLSDAQADPILRFGLQQGGLPMDPHSQTEDLGDDSMKASEYGIKNLKYILSHLNEWVKDDADFEYRKDIYTGIVYQYYNYLLHVYANIGGVYLWQKCDGDPVERAHQVVPPETQKRALQFLMDQVSDMDWLDNAALLADIPTVGQPSKVLKAFLAQAIVSAPAKVARTIAVAEKDDPVYSVKECLKDVNDFVWKPTGTLNDVQMMLQREFLSLTFAASGYSYAGNGAVPSRSLAQAPAVPEMLRDYDHMIRSVCYYDGADVSLGYSTPTMMFVGQNVDEALFFSYAEKARKTVSSRRRSGDADTQAHYELLLRNIEKTLK